MKNDLYVYLYKLSAEIISLLFVYDKSKYPLSKGNVNN